MYGVRLNMYVLDKNVTLSLNVHKATKSFSVLNKRVH